MSAADVDAKARQYRQDIRALLETERDLGKQLAESRTVPCKPGMIGDLCRQITKARAQRQVKEMLLNRLVQPGLFDPVTPS